jgi:folylpolyglutamate synthase/dihydropteroate synthase
LNKGVDLEKMKTLNFTINDSAHEKLEAIKSAKNINNNAEAIEFLIEEVFKQLEEKETKNKMTEVGIKGRLSRIELKEDELKHGKMGRV